jgi:hypothetical protein
LHQPLNIYLLYTSHSSLYEVYDGSAPQYRTGKWKQAFDIEQVSSLFNLPLLHKRFQFDAPAVRSHVWARIKSKSYIAILDDKEKELLGRQVEKVLNNPEYGFPIDDSKEFIYPHDSDLYWIRKI